MGSLPRRNIIGIALMSVSGAFLTSTDAVSKIFVGHYSVSQILFVQSCCAILTLLVFSACRGELRSLRAHSWSRHAVRGGLYVGGSFAFITALRYLPLADAVAITFASPILIATLGSRYLGESVSKKRYVAIGVGFAGVIVMLRPGGDGFQWAVLLPLVVALADTGRDLLTRTMTATESTVSMILFTTLTVAVVSCPLALATWTPLPATHIALFVVSGTLFISAHYLMVEAYRQGEAGVVAPFRYFMLIWSALAGFLLFGDVPDAWLLLGAVLTVGSGIYMLYLEAT